MAEENCQLYVNFQCACVILVELRSPTTDFHDPQQWSTVDVDLEFAVHSM